MKNIVYLFLAFHMSASALDAVNLTSSEITGREFKIFKIREAMRYYEATPAIFRFDGWISFSKSTSQTLRFQMEGELDQLSLTANRIIDMILEVESQPIHRIYERYLASIVQGQTSFQEISISESQWTNWRGQWNVWRQYQEARSANDFNHFQWDFLVRCFKAQSLRVTFDEGVWIQTSVNYEEVNCPVAGSGN